MELIGKRIEKTIRNKLVKSFPMLAMFLTDDMVEKVTNLFKSELQDFPYRLLPRYREKGWRRI